MAQVITGARGLVKLSGDVIFFAGGISVDHENRLKEIPQLDSQEVAEWMENGHRCSVTIRSFKLASDASIGGQKIGNSAATFSLDHEDDLRQILLQPEMIIEIVDSVPIKDANGNIVDYNEVATYTAFGAKFAGGTGELDARGIWNGTWNFKARRGTGI